jgi:hypothetical protein
LGAGGQDGFEAGRAAWITVDHFTARPTQETIRTDPETGEVYTEMHSVKVAGDPALHSHCLVPNLIRTASGRYTAIDTAAFHGQIHHFGAVYQALLARELTALGVYGDDLRPAGAIYNYKQAGFVGTWKAQGQTVPISARRKWRRALPARCNGMRPTSATD